MEPRKIALFGGTFDPPHLGHIEIARAAIDQAGIDEVLFIPCAISPHKTSSPPTPAADRLAMLELACHNLPWAKISDIELQLPPPSFTWRTVQALTPTFPENTKLYWILGADQWQCMETWARPRFLRDHLHFLVVPREGDNIMPRDHWSASVIRADHPASSSAIRKDLSLDPENGEWITWLHPAVLDYIRSHQLYHSAKPTQ